MKKVYPDAKSALAGQLKDGMTIMAGGFGLCGIPETLILAIRDSGVKNLTFVSNNAGIDGAGLGLLLETRQVKKMISSYGQNKLFAEQYLAGVLRSSSPRRARWLSASAPVAPHPGLLHQDRLRHNDRRRRCAREFDGEHYIMERGIVADLAIVHAWKADTEGNLVYRKTAQFQSDDGNRRTYTIAEVEHLVEPDRPRRPHHHPGVYVQRIVHVPNAQKKIEQRTVRKRS